MLEALQVLQNTLSGIHTAGRASTSASPGEISNITTFLPNPLISHAPEGEHDLDTQLKDKTKSHRYSL